MAKRIRHFRIIHDYTYNEDTGEYDEKVFSTNPDIVDEDTGDEVISKGAVDQSKTTTKTGALAEFKKKFGTI